MRIFLANLVFAFVLISCESNTTAQSIESKDSIGELAKIRTADSFRMADSIGKATKIAQQHSDSLQKPSILNDQNKTQNLSLELISNEVMQTGPINQALSIYQDQKITYSKNFAPSISFSATNNSEKTVDLFRLSINLKDHSNPVEKNIEKTIKPHSKLTIKFSLNESGTVINYGLIKIHYSDGTII